MNGEQLKNSILQFAIQGKLVPQDPNDEPASALIERIRKEKGKLVKDGKLKKSSLIENAISTDDYLFNLPVGWVFARLDDISLDSADGPFGSNLKREHYTENKEVRIIQLSNIGEMGWKDANTKYTTFEHLKNISRSEAFAGDIIIAKMMPAGRAIICPDLDKKYVLSSDAVRFNFSSVLDKRYLYYAINSPVFKEQVYDEVQGITRVRTSLNKLRTYILPLPPLAEQKRIVAKLKEILPLVESYDKAQQKLDELNKALPDRLRKSILQEAIQGKLVEQDPNDEPASVLLECIREEKQKLVKAKVVKAEKNESSIYRGEDGSWYEKVGKCEPKCIDEDIPYTLPNSWIWIRLKMVADIARGGSPRPIKDYLTNSLEGYNWIKIGDTDKGGKYINRTQERIKPEGISKTRLVHKGDFLLTNSMSFGRPYITNVDGCIHDGWLVISPIKNSYDSNFLYYLLSSPFAFSQFSGLVSGAVVKNLNSDKVAESFMPLPPLAEQKRIVAKLDELLKHIK